MEKRYILNHYYWLRHDLKRSYVLASNKELKNAEQARMVQTDCQFRIHPILAMALSLFSEPHTLDELKESFADFFNISGPEAEKFIQLFLNNSETFTIPYGGYDSSFPKNIVIEADKQFVSPVAYSPEQFAYKELDMKRERPFLAPLSMVLMINNICATDCIYCYANKKVKSTPIPFERIKEIVKEAHDLKISQFNIVGGEVLLYRQWEELFQLLRSYDMLGGLVSTKVPIGEDTVIALKKYHLKVQISLDAMHSGRLQEILQVSPLYAEKIKRTIELLEKHRVGFQVATVLTKCNKLPEDLEELYRFLQPLKCLQRWDIRIAFKSLYSRGDFEKYKLSKEDVETVDQWVKGIRPQTTMHIQWLPDGQRKYFSAKEGSRSFQGSRCSANYSNLFVLPDGKVTICEQLYWNPRFLIGDLNTQSIQEVWNSPEALALAFPKRENFREESACHSCKLFDECMDFPNRCIVDILKGYGPENWDYPDPRCAQAPPFIYDLLND